MRVVRPPATRMLAGSIPSGVRTRRLLSTNSAGGMAWEVISCQLSVISWRDNANLELARISRRAHHRLRQREAPRGRPRRVDRRDSDRSVTARQPRPPPGARLATHLDDLQLRGALDQHGALHTDLLLGAGVDDGGGVMGAGLVTGGVNWWEALLTILLGNTIVLVPILLNSHPGTRYGIPFPVFARAAYGTLGSNLPAIMRALVTCVWFGIQCWIAGAALNTLFSALDPRWTTRLGSGWSGHTGAEWLSFFLFWALNILIVYRGMDLLRKVENWAAPFVLVLTGALFA